MHEPMSFRLENPVPFGRMNFNLTCGTINTNTTASPLPLLTFHAIINSIPYSLSIANLKPLPNILTFPIDCEYTIRKELSMEIERKYLVTTPLPNYDSFPSHFIEQAYLCTEPVVRIRKEDDSCYLTYKSKGLLVREEYNLPLTLDAYEHLLPKADGIVLTKRRYMIPIKDTDLTIELDVFSGKYEGLMLAEVEFKTKEEAENFNPPLWFGKDVTFSGEYQNSRLALQK